MTASRRHRWFTSSCRMDTHAAYRGVPSSVTAFAAHKTQGHVRAAERAGLAVVTVPVAGAEAFRRALLGWRAQWGEAAAEASAASRPT